MPEIPEDLKEELNVLHLKDAERIIAVTGGGYWPTLFNLKDGSIAAILRGGAPHVGLNSRLDFIISKDGGKKWEKSLIVPGIKKLDVRGSASGITADGTIVTGYVETDWYISGKFDVSKYKFESFYKYSTDNGKTWSEKKSLKVEGIENAALYGRIIVLKDKTSIMPAYGINKKTKKGVTGFLKSYDNGKTWGDYTIIAEKFNETTFIELPDRRILAIMRAENRAVPVWQTESADNGKTWSKPIQITKEHQHPADYCLLKSGNLLLTYGNRIGDLVTGGMLSYDLGKTWDKENRFIIERETLMLRGKTWGDCGYPSTVQVDDGTIVTICYKLGSTKLSKKDQETCLQYERDTFLNPPSSEDMRRFEYGVVIRYSEDDIKKAIRSNKNK